MIQHNEGGSTTITGGHIQWFALRTLLSGLKLEQKHPGLKMSRHFSALAKAKQMLGLPPRKRLKYEDAIAAIEKLSAEAMQKAEANG